MADPAQDFKAARRIERVALSKDGIRGIIWNSAADKYTEMTLPSALHLLRCECTIDPDVTLKDILRVVEQEHGLVHFLGVWSRCDIDAFHSEAYKPSDDSDLDCIEVSKQFSWEEHGAEETISVHGIGDAGCANGETEQREFTHYAIWLTPVNELAQLRVRLRPVMEIYKEAKKLGEASCTFTLLEVLGEIYFQISWAGGSPSSRDQRRAELLSSSTTDRT